jgi:hypothetical protein
VNAVLRKRSRIGGSADADEGWLRVMRSRPWSAVKCGELRLASHGYPANKRTFFIWEAVTQYLTETGIRTTFDFLAKAARGSRLVLTFVRKDFLDGQVMYGQEGLYKRYVARDKI